MADLFSDDRPNLTLGPGAVLLGGFALEHGVALLDGITRVAAAAPFRNLETPGGRRMSVAMTNAGRLGWMSDRSGYRYEDRDPQSSKPWPAMPPAFLAVARSAAFAAGFATFEPDACLVNRYEPGARLSLHQDRDERNLDQPIVSVSLGVDAIFLWGGDARSDRPRKIALRHGDVVVWGDRSRLAFHGVEPVMKGFHPLTSDLRYNLTFRQVT